MVKAFSLFAAVLPNTMLRRHSAARAVGVENKLIGIRAPHGVEGNHLPGPL